MSVETFEKGEDLVTFGSIGDKFYIIIQGKASVLVPENKAISPDEN